MEVAEMNGSQEDNLLRARSRVVDHWKRLFAIITGFAITAACQRAYLCYWNSDWAGILEFIAFISTVPPVFHGMERSLDLRYLEPKSESPSAWTVAEDTFVIITTGIFFLALALSIPDYTTNGRRDLHVFPVLLSAFLFFDVIALLKTSPRFNNTKSHISTHYGLAILNAMALILIMFVLYCQNAQNALMMQVIIGLIAILRSWGDYMVSKDFLYPQGDVE
jgi:hypothetical protein